MRPYSCTHMATVGVKGLNVLHSCLAIRHKVCNKTQSQYVFTTPCSLLDMCMCDRSSGRCPGIGEAHVGVEDHWLHGVGLNRDRSPWCRWLHRLHQVPADVTQTILLAHQIAVGQILSQ